MTGCVFIGDAVSAAGLRLAGVHCLTPSPTPDAVLAVFSRYRSARTNGQTVDQVRGQDGAGLIILTAQMAALLPAPMLAAALREQDPPVVVVADLRGEQAEPDRAAALRRQLGMAE